jgi:PAS domain S-box-containing protein
MFGGDAIVLWQFHTVRLQADRSNGFDQELAAVLRAHASLLAFHDRLESIADDEDTGRLAIEAGPMNSAILGDAERARKDLNSLPSGVQPDPTILPTLQAIQKTMRSQLEEITNLANMGEWSAVHLRLANQIQPLEFLSTTLVEKVDHEASEAQAQAALNIRQVQDRVFLVVPITVVFTLLVAGTLGLAITRSITRPLARLVEGSQMLARGEFQYQVAVAGNDELARLGHVFNDTARQLQDLYASLQNSEVRLRRVIDTIPAHVWSTFPDGSVDFINQRLMESTGLSAKELLGSGWHSIVCPDDLAKYVDEWQIALSLGKTAESEVRVLTAHRDYRWMLIRNVPLRDSLGNIVKWYGTAIDIEDRKRVEEQLRRSEAYLAEAQRLSRTGSFGWQVSTGETLWSDETYQIFGYEKALKPSLERVVNRTHPEDKELVRQFLQRVSSEETSFDAELRLLMPDDEVKYIHVVARVMKNSSGVNECIGAVTDVSPVKQAAEALRKAQSDLAHVNRITTMGELSASLAHEVNQPIAGAIINASTCMRWLTREDPNLDEARESAARTIRDVNRAAEIISRIKLFFKKGTLQTESIDVNEIIREMIVLLRNEATRYSVSVRTELTTDIPPIIGDRVQLQQVLMNLMVNGIDAMKNVDGPRQLTLRSYRGENEQLLVSIADTGIGLPPHQADQIFNAFFTTKSHGTGMGLRISRTIIAAHGGRLWANDNSPRGAIFQFTLASKPRVRNDNSTQAFDGIQ